MKININTATTELCQLPGVDEKLALKVVAYRARNGPFNHPKNLINVDSRFRNILKQAKDIIVILPLQKIDINSAVRGLVELPDVDEVLALKIIQYRKDHGPFERIEELRQVDARLDKIYDQLQHMITLKKLNWLRTLGPRGYLQVFSDLGQGLGGIISGIALLVSLYVAWTTAEGLRLEMAVTRAELARAGLVQSGFTPIANLSFPRIPTEDMAVGLNSTQDFATPNFIFQIENHGDIVVDEVQIKLAVISPTELRYLSDTVEIQNITVNPGFILQGDITEQILEMLSSQAHSIGNGSTMISILLKADLTVSAVQQDYLVETHSSRIIEIHTNQESLTDAQDIIKRYENSPISIEHK